MIPKPGEKAPSFSAYDQDGNLVKLSDYKGKKVVLYFYPQDDTPTCTTQACNLRDNMPALQAAGYHVIGVSEDNEKSHLKFRAKYDLNFTLLADVKHKIIDAYGVWQEKTLFGRTYLGIIRTTFIINEKGMVERVIHPVTSATHSQQILGQGNKTVTSK